MPMMSELAAGKRLVSCPNEIHQNTMEAHVTVMQPEFTFSGLHLP